MSLFDLVVRICTLEITFYFVVVLIYTLLTLAICCQAAYQNSDDFLRKKAIHPDFAIRAHVDYDTDHLEARAKCLRILQEWRNDIYKQMVILSSRLEKKHSMVRQHCKTIVDILKEELHSTESQMKLIAQNDAVDSLVDSQLVEDQLSMVRLHSNFPAVQGAPVKWWIGNRLDTSARRIAYTHVRIFIEDLEKCLTRVPKSLDFMEWR